MAVTHEIIESYKNYGRCVKISNGIIEAYVTVDVGPRIIRFAKNGGENVLFTDINRKSMRCGAEYDNYYYKSATWYLYGGHRLWLTPESAPETYYPDNQAVEFEYTETGAVFTPNEQKENKIAMQIEVQMAEKGTDMKVIHRVKNCGEDNRQCSLWGITVLNQNGLEIIPQNNDDTALLPNRTLAMWPYTDVTDSRFYFGKDYITLRQDPTMTSAFKIGTDNKAGFAAYAVGNDVFVCRFEHKDGVEYPDNGVCFETYTDGTVLELETLSEIFDIEPNEWAENSVTWSLYQNPGQPDPKDQTAIKEFINKLI